MIKSNVWRSKLPKNTISGGPKIVKTVVTIFKGYNAPNLISARTPLHTPLGSSQHSPRPLRLYLCVLHLRRETTGKGEGEGKGSQEEVGGRGRNERGKKRKGRRTPNSHFWL